MSDRLEKILDEALKSEPKLDLREGFAEGVVKAVRKKESSKQRKIYLWMIVGCLIMFGFGYAMMKAFIPEAFEGQGLFSLGDQFNNVIPIAVILGIVIVAIQYLDRKLVKEKYLFG